MEQHGQSGLWVSDWLPHIATRADDIAVIRSCCGRRHQPFRRRLPDEYRLDPRRPAVAGRVGHLWPGHREPEPAGLRRHAGQRRHAWSTARATGAPASCPPSTRASRLQGGAEPIPNLNTPEGVSDEQQRGKLDLLDAAQPPARRDAARSRPNSTPASPATNSPSACRPRRRRRSISRRKPRRRKRSTASTTKRPTSFGRNCLLARRLVERGVRFVQLYHGAGSKWDAHTQASKRTTRELCRAIDKPIAGLLNDLKARGLLERRWSSGAANSAARR